MNKSFQVVSFNKNYLPTESLVLDVNNRAFRYGDGLFETMHANAGKVQLLDAHFDRLSIGAEILSLQLPDYFSVEYLHEHIAGLLHRCRLYQGAKVKLSLIRQVGGLYIPESNAVDVLIEASYLSDGPYHLNKPGIRLGIYDEYPKQMGPLSGFKSFNAAFYILAGNYAKMNDLDDVLLINEGGGIVEATSSNVFLVFHDRVLTPALSEGCVSGIMRKQVIKEIRSMGLKLEEQTHISTDDLRNAEEVFLTNAVSGIKWVLAFDKTRYVKRLSRRLIERLNQEM